MTLQFNSIMDLDDSGSWPRRIRTYMDRHLSSLEAERRIVNEFYGSGDRWDQPRPQTPSIDTFYTLVQEATADKRLRVFHATRVVEKSSIKKMGLNVLSMDERLEAIKLVARDRPAIRNLNFDRLFEKARLEDPIGFENRPGKLYAVPLRRLLFDGGCDELLGSFGGEALRRVAQHTELRLEEELKRIGEPAVVVATIPAHGFCKFSAERLPETMLTLALSEQGSTKFALEAWDVMMTESVPAEWIEAVLDPESPLLKHVTPKDEND